MYAFMIGRLRYDMQLIYQSDQLEIEMQTTCFCNVLVLVIYSSNGGRLV